MCGWVVSDMRTRRNHDIFSRLLLLLCFCLSDDDGLLIFNNRAWGVVVYLAGFSDPSGCEADFLVAPFVVDSLMSWSACVRGVRDEDSSVGSDDRFGTGGCEERERWRGKLRTNAAVGDGVALNSSVSDRWGGSDVRFGSSAFGGGDSKRKDSSETD